MKLKKEKIVLIISITLVCIILIAIMFAQFRTIEETDITGIKNAKEAELRTMLSSWKSKYDETVEKLEDTNKKIKEYQDKISSDEAAEELLEEELEQTNILSGKTDISGEGVVVTLSDNNEKSIVAEDLLRLVNELRLAGAEAIAINDERVLGITEIVDVNGNILVNTKRIISPYIVKVIGSQTYLSSALSLKNSGYIDNCKNEGKTIEMKQEKNIKILAYNGIRQMKYAKEVKKE